MAIAPFDYYIIQKSAGVSQAPSIIGGDVCSGNRILVRHPTLVFKIEKWKGVLPIRRKRFGRNKTLPALIKPWD